MDRRVMPEIDQRVCIRCGGCAEQCPSQALSLSDDGIHLDLKRCSYCGQCEIVCPTDAIALPYEIVLRTNTDQ